MDKLKWFDDVAVGDTVTLARTITEADAALYIAATGDFGPVHVDAEHARGTRFGERIAPGIMIGAMATSVLTSELLGPLGVSIEDTFRFKGPVRYGDTITLDVRIARKWWSGRPPVSTSMARPSWKSKRWRSSPGDPPTGAAHPSAEPLR
jgi:3-hydroxybutyryl-CoA dehydratase